MTPVDKWSARVKVASKELRASRGNLKKKKNETKSHAVSHLAICLTMLMPCHKEEGEFIHTHANSYPRPPPAFNTLSPTGSPGNLRVADCLQIIAACFPRRSKAISCLLTPH